MFGLGIGELLVILIVILLLFGAKKIPEIGKALGQGIRMFKKEADEMKKAVVDNSDNEEKPNVPKKKK